MSKKIETMSWRAVALDGFPSNITNKLEGFVGLEECTDYGTEKAKKLSKKKKQLKLHQEKNTKSFVKENNDKKIISNKKNPLINGFYVEECSKITPSVSNEAQEQNHSKESINCEILGGNKLNKKKKLKLGENKLDVDNTLTPEDMLSWAEFKLPDEITKALMDLGFKQPTKIQQMSLPAAIHGRRDILGAAETGSGKTLAFGLPILTGIMKLKEKAVSKNLDVYDIPYKKMSVKRKIAKDKVNKKVNNKKQKVKNKNVVKESSEDGYSSGEESNDDIPNENDKPVIESKHSDDDFLEEMEVPFKKQGSIDEGNDSDSDGHIHLSEMFDSDDLASSDESNSGNVDKDDETQVDDDQVMDEDENDEGIGCVKVLDNIEFPGHVQVKTGKPLYALILTPTRELAVQISRHLIAVAKYTGIRVATIVGGMAAVKQERVLRSGPEIVVATPGRLWELVNQAEAHLLQLPYVKFLAIDETDRMVERGHFDELEPLLERLNSDETHRNSRQNFVFSATLTMVHELPAHLRGKKVTKRGKVINRKVQQMTAQQKISRLVAKLGMTDPKVVDITSQNLGTAETLKESRITCSLDQKDAYIYYILRRYPGRTIVFCNSINSVKRLVQLLCLLQCCPLPLHANMQQRQRLKNLERFRDDPHGVLIATDVAARGLDIPDVDHVVHYQVPRTAENYVHRSGRTARANKEGLTILMMEPAEAFTYSKLCRTLNRTSEIANFPVSSESIEALKQTIKLAREVETLEQRRSKASRAASWREKAAREMDIIIDEDDIPMTQVAPGIDKVLQGKRRELQTLLSRPLFPRGYSFKYPTLNDPRALENSGDNALQVMKKALGTGELKKEKRKTKNQSLLELQKALRK